MHAMKVPSKESVREWLISRCRRKTPLPEPAEIRDQLGWDVHADTGGTFDAIADTPQFVAEPG